MHELIPTESARRWRPSVRSDFLAALPSRLNFLNNLDARKPIRDLPKQLHHVQIVVREKLPDPMAFTRPRQNVVLVLMTLISLDCLVHQAVQVGRNYRE